MREKHTPKFIERIKLKQNQKRETTPKFIKNIGIKKKTREISLVHESEEAKKFGGKRMPNSGATNNVSYKGDCERSIFLMECKATEGDRIVIHEEALNKVNIEATRKAGKLSCMSIRFGSGKKYYLISEPVFEGIINDINNIIKIQGDEDAVG